MAYGSHGLTDTHTSGGSRGPERSCQGYPGFGTPSRFPVSRPHSNLVSASLTVLVKHERQTLTLARLVKEVGKQILHSTLESPLCVLRRRRPSTWTR